MTATPLKVSPGAGIDATTQLAADESVTGIGVIATYDFAADRELWRWTPESATLHITRTPWHDTPMNVEMARLVAETQTISDAARNIMKVEPAVMAYACTSGSFIDGIEGEANLRQAMTDAGAAHSITTSGALISALHHLGAAKVSLITPYTADVTEALVDFLDTCGVVTTGSADMGLTDRIWTVPYTDTIRMVMETDHSAADAVFISCTNLSTYDIIEPLEKELGKPVLSANQVTMWAALQQGGVELGPSPGRLFSTDA